MSDQPAREAEPSSEPSSGLSGPAIDSAGSAPRRAPHRPPPELIATVVIGYVGGVSQIVSGIVLMFARYLDDTAAGERLVVTIVGACTVLLGLLVITVASGLTRARRDARVLVTVLFGLAIGLDVLTLVASPEQWFVIAETVLLAASVTVLWTGRTARFFARTDGARTG